MNKKGCLQAALSSGVRYFWKLAVVAACRWLGFPRGRLLGNLKVVGFALEEYVGQGDLAVLLFYRRVSTRWMFRRNGDYARWDIRYCVLAARDAQLHVRSFSAPFDGVLAWRQLLALHGYRLK
jgi:hypothetical protein